MENAPLIISGSLSVGPTPGERPGRRETPASASLTVLLEGLDDGPPGPGAVKRGRPWLGRGALCDSFLAAVCEAIRTEPAALPAEAGRWANTRQEEFEEPVERKGKGRGPVGDVARSRRSGSEVEPGRQSEAARASRTDGGEQAVDAPGKEAPREDTSGGPANALSAGSGTLQALAAPDGEIVERLDAAFDEIFSATPLPRNLQARIELARSIGRQVIRDAVVSVKNGRMEVVLQLRPPGLGAVRMQLSLQGRTISVRLSVDNALVREVVEHYLPQLRSVLREEGFLLDRFEVSVRGRSGSESWASAQAEGQGRGEEHASAAEGDESPGVEANVAPVHDGTVDYLA